jgi:hypothetical protein
MSKDTKYTTTREKIIAANQIYATYPLFNRVLEDIYECHYSPETNADSDPDCLLLMGEAGAGKTTIYKTYAQNYPRQETDEGSIVPIVYTPIPVPATVKGLVEAILKKLGDPLYNKGTTTNQTSRAYDLLAACKVEIIVLDEFHHFIDRESQRVLRNVCDWLKNLILNTRIPVVLFGLPESKRILEVDNSQLSRRFTYRHELIPFPRNDLGMKLFRQFLSDIEEQLPLAEKSGLATKSLSERIYYATDGTIAHVMTLIRQGTTLAIKQDLKRLDLEILNIIYERHLKHEKPFKCTEPFLVKKLDFEASYALDISKQINQNNRKGNLRSILHS